MRERECNQITVTCDYCGEGVTTATINYKQLNAELMEDGWHFRRDESGEWLDFCCMDCGNGYFDIGRK